MEESFFLGILEREIIPAMGCTEPAATALAGAKARELLGSSDIGRVVICASRDMIKNAMGVVIPGCPKKGISAAAALGVAVGDSSRKLNILSDVTQEMVDFASGLETELILSNDVPPLYVQVSLLSGDHQVSVTVAGEHDSFSKIVVDGKVLLDTGAHCYFTKTDSSEFEDVTMEDILHFADNVDVGELGIIRTAIAANMDIARHSMEHGYGLQVGRTMARGHENPTSLDCAFSLGASYAASGSDARMSGCPMPVYINSGSGNQGMAVTIPVKIVGDYLGVGEEKILRAVCVSELVALMLTEKKSRLSALCGAFTASIGTACAYSYLLGGREVQMDEVVNTMVADLTGIICDGAKNTCPLKILSCLHAAAMATKLAICGKAPGQDCGIVGSDGKESISHLTRISNEGMKETDEAIYSIMMDKNGHC